MGLDITAYRRLRQAAPGEGMDPEYPESADYANGYVRLWVHRDFPERAPEIGHEGIYKPEGREGFRAGSYSGYNEWRDALAKLAGYDSDEAAWALARALPAGATAPFIELINFADNEGVIGAAVSAKLAKDFADFQAQADAHPDAYFREKYARWRRAFEMAADGGAVEFH